MYMTIELLNTLLSLHTGNEVRFGPIRHSEYTIEFHLIDGFWNIEGENLIYSDAREKNEYDYNYINGYVNETQPATHILTIAAYICDDILKHTGITRWTLRRILQLMRTKCM